jgi:dTDP-glucose pyrophosphorylase
MNVIEIIDKLKVDPDETLDQILIKMDSGKEGILLVVDDNDSLIGIITDGDIRREIISSGPNSTSSAKKIMTSNPVVSQSDNSAVWQEKFNQNDIEHLPICDDSNKVTKLVRLSNYSRESNKKIPVLIVAGGKGTRMGKKYSKTPKALLDVNGKTLIEITLRKLIKNGFNDVTLALNYEAEQIIDHVKKLNLKLNIDFYIESKPLGTAGSIIKIAEEKQEDNMLILNSDILFEVDFTDLLNFHNLNNNDLTIATSDYEIEIPYGVIEKEELKEIKSPFEIVEKPKIKYDIVAGIYVINKEFLLQLNYEEIDMDKVIEIAKENKLKVSIFSIGNRWIDIGTPENLEIAQKLDVLYSN